MRKNALDDFIEMISALGPKPYREQRVPDTEYLYHGTINTFVPKILTEGLVPTKENAWDSDMETMFGNVYNPKKDDKPGFVYLASEESWAVRYAKGKANYFRAKPGETFVIGSLKMVKGHNAPVIEDAVATVLRIKATPELSVRLQKDEHDCAATKVKGVVPAELISIDENPNSHMPLSLALTS